jgi:hypothetical protein
MVPQDDALERLTVLEQQKFDLQQQLQAVSGGGQLATTPGSTPGGKLLTTSASGSRVGGSPGMAAALHAEVSAQFSLKGSLNIPRQFPG